MILASAHRDEITDTDTELLLLSLITAAGLPEPVLHHEIYDGERFVAEVDLAYPRWKIAIESDGSVHTDPDVRALDLRRQNDLVLEGWTVLRFDLDRVRDNPSAVLREIRDAIAVATAAAQD